MLCKKCGKPIDTGAVFCGQCGEKIEAAKPINPAEIPADEYRRRTNATDISRSSQEPTKKKTSWLGFASIASSVFFTGMCIFNFFKSSDGGDTNHQTKVVATSNVAKQNISKPNNSSTTKKTVKGTAKTTMAKSYNTKGRPKIDDFVWTNTVMKNGVWNSAIKVTAFKDIIGTWKCMNTYDPENKAGNYCRDISNVTISGTERNVKVYYDWYKIFYNGEPPQDMTKGPKTTLTGTYQKGSTGKFELVATSKGTRFAVDKFYIYNGKQYAIGTILVADGTIGNVTMVRP